MSIMVRCHTLRLTYYSEHNGTACTAHHALLQPTHSISKKFLMRNCPQWLIITDYCIGFTRSQFELALRIQIPILSKIFCTVANIFRNTGNSRRELNIFKFQPNSQHAAQNKKGFFLSYAPENQLSFANQPHRRCEQLQWLDRKQGHPKKSLQILCIRMVSLICCNYENSSVPDPWHLSLSGYLDLHLIYGSGFCPAMTFVSDFQDANKK